jgi:hypothetical protein
MSAPESESVFELDDRNAKCDCDPDTDAEMGSNTGSSALPVGGRITSPEMTSRGNLSGW